MRVLHNFEIQMISGSGYETLAIVSTSGFCGSIIGAGIAGFVGQAGSASASSLEEVLIFQPLMYALEISFGAFTGAIGGVMLSGGILFLASNMVSR